MWWISVRALMIALAVLIASGVLVRQWHDRGVDHVSQTAMRAPMRWLGGYW